MPQTPQTPHRRSSHFGKYLKQLREQRRLTLYQVEELSIPYQKRIPTAYLSKCENGRLRPTLDRLVVLSKIYGASFGALADRLMAEDEFADGPPVDLSSSSYEELQMSGNELLARGELKRAFSYYRAAEERIFLEEDAGRSAEKVARARLCMAIALQQMGRYRLARDEAERAMQALSGPSEVRFNALLVISTCSFRLGSIDLAQSITTALKESAASLSRKQESDLELLRGNIEFERARYREALKAYRKAASCYHELEERSGESRAKKNAANCYSKLGEQERALEYVQKALEISRRLDDKQKIAADLQALGAIQLRIGHHKIAKSSLYKAIEISRKGDYFDTLFCAYYYLWLIEKTSGDSQTAASIQRTLSALLPKLEENLEEAAQFQDSSKGID